jgi:hypothetical protein
LHKEKRPSTWKNFENNEKIKKYEKPEKNNKKSDDRKKQAILNAIIEADSEKSNSDSETEEINVLEDHIDFEKMDFDLDLNISKVNNISPYNIFTYTDDKFTDITNYFQREIEFIVDTAATVTAIYDLSYFYTYKATKRTVQWGKAKNINIKYEGTLIFRTNMKSIYILENVLFIPELGINILSTNSIKNKICLFTDNKCIIYNKNKKAKPTLIAYKKEKLYKTKIDILSKRNNNNQILNIESENKENKEKIIIWHKRLGHINAEALQKLLQNNNINVGTLISTSDI